MQIGENSSGDAALAYDRRPRPLGFGPWTLDSGLWTLDFGLWTLDLGLSAVDPGVGAVGGVGVDVGLDAAVGAVVLVAGVDPLAVLDFDEAVPGVVGAGVGVGGVVGPGHGGHVAAGVVVGLVQVGAEGSFNGVLVVVSVLRAPLF